MLLGSYTAGCRSKDERGRAWVAPGPAGSRGGEGPLGSSGPGAGDPDCLSAVNRQRHPKRKKRRGRLPRREPPGVLCRGVSSQTGCAGREVLELPEPHPGDLHPPGPLRSRAAHHSSAGGWTWFWGPPVPAGSDDSRGPGAAPSGVRLPAVRLDCGALGPRPHR
ncbi:hypothetical protein NDU88_003640 [Pleurodeles waltl]|uniref:Uncharacterized protein n=1 Tax=Pleurodeles waltl TaxID=8319 RepID=A0AAV7LNP3_PLEWA|nr:hypothetical protein NDU88_003640 [Pleurodeles waltl]